MNCKKTKLADLLSENLGRYKWVGGKWPAIPKSLGPLDFDPRLDLDGPPPWAAKIHLRLWEDILPLKKDMTWADYCSAMAGYAFASCHYEANERKRFALALLGRESQQEEVGDEIEAQALMVKELRESAQKLGCEAMEKGFAYGVECRQREPSLTPSTKTETLQILKALVQNWRQVKILTKQEATAKELAVYIASKAIRQDGRTFGEYFADTTKKSRVDANAHYANVQFLEGKQERYLKLFQKICGEFEIPLVRQGRPIKAQRVPQRAAKTRGVPCSVSHKKF